MQERIYEVQSSFHQGAPGAGGAAAPPAPDKFLFDAVYSGGPPLGAGPRRGAGQQPVHRRGLFSAVGGHGLPGGVLSASPYPVRGVGSGQLLCRPVPGDAGAPLGSDRPEDGGGGVGELLLLPTGPMLAGIALVALLAWLLRHKFREGRFLIDRRTAPSAVSPWSWASSA